MMQSWSVCRIFRLMNCTRSRIMQVEKLKTIDADTLLSTPMRKTLFVVDGLIPQGLSVLSGSSKIGKSWLMLWLGIQVARGQPVWEFETHKRKSLCV